MLEKLKTAEEKYIGIENDLAKPDIFSNQDEYTRLMKDYKALTPSMRATFNRVLRQDMTECLPRIKASTLLVWGEDDTATPLWMGQEMEKCIKGSALIVLENAGHFAYLDQCAQFLRIAEAFLLPKEA